MKTCLHSPKTCADDMSSENEDVFIRHIRYVCVVDTDTSCLRRMKTCLHATTWRLSSHGDMSSFSEDTRRMKTCLHAHVFILRVSSENDIRHSHIDMSRISFSMKIWECRHTCADDMENDIRQSYIILHVQSYIILISIWRLHMSSCTCLYDILVYHSPKTRGEYTTFSYRYEDCTCLHATIENEDMSSCDDIRHAHIDMKTIVDYRRMNVHSTIVAWMYILISSHECTFSYRRMKIWECRHTCADDMSSENEHVFMCRRYVFGEWRCLHVPTICLHSHDMSTQTYRVFWRHLHSPKTCRHRHIVSSEDIEDTISLCRHSPKTRYVCVDNTICLCRHSPKTRYVCDIEDTICLCRQHDMSVSVTSKTRYVCDMEDTICLGRHSPKTRYVCDIDNTICLCLWHRQHDMSVSSFSEDTICLCLHSPKTRYVCVDNTICLWHRRHDMSVSTYRVFDVYDMSSFSEDTICLCRLSPKTRYVCVDFLRRHDMSVSTFSEDTICLCRLSPKTRYVCVDDMSVPTICLCRRYTSIYSWMKIHFRMKTCLHSPKTCLHSPNVSWGISNLGNLKPRKSQISGHPFYCVHSLRLWSGFHKSLKYLNGSFRKRNVQGKAPEVEMQYNAKNLKE